MSINYHEEPQSDNCYDAKSLVSAYEETAGHVLKRNILQTQFVQKEMNQTLTACT
jgi:hypothetical protein